MNPVKKRHAFVLGSGIAGLAITELLTRNGWRVSILETSTKLGGDASLATQNWFHTGWLYAALPNPEAMLGCANAVKLYQQVYGSVIPPEILNINTLSGSPSYSASSQGWFTPSFVHYFYAASTQELSYWQRRYWRHYLQHVPFRRLARLGYSTLQRNDLSFEVKTLLNRWESDADGFRKYFVIQTTDASINTRRVLNTLIGLFGTAANVILNANYEMHVDNGKTVIHIERERHAPDLVVLATGKNVSSHLVQLGNDALSRQIRSISSPIVVLDQPLRLPNFIRFTPRLPETINHLKYETQAKEVSTIGSYDYFPAGRSFEVEPFIERVCRRLSIPTHNVIGTYFGTKTEFVGNRSRRYNHALEQVNENTFMTLAGKFSQFPLLVYEFAQRLRLHTSKPDVDRGYTTHESGKTEPERLISLAYEPKPS